VGGVLSPSLVECYLLVGGVLSPSG